MKPFSLRNFAKLWHCDAEFEPAGENAVHIFEWLDVDLPEDVRASCYYSDTVGFYGAENGRKLAEVRHHALGGLEDLVLLNDGIWYEVSSGRVVYHNGRWCMRWWAWKNTRRAAMMNAGFPAYRK